MVMVSSRLYLSASVWSQVRNVRITIWIMKGKAQLEEQLFISEAYTYSTVCRWHTHTACIWRTIEAGGWMPKGFRREKEGDRGEKNEERERAARTRATCYRDSRWIRKTAMPPCLWAEQWGENALLLASSLAKAHRRAATVRAARTQLHAWIQNSLSAAGIWGRSVKATTPKRRCPSPARPYVFVEREQRTAQQCNEGDAKARDGAGGQNWF